MSEVQSSAALTVVLVHGGFVDGAGWEGVYKLLRKHGYNVSIVQNPTLTLADDVAATRLVIAQAKGPVVLVGHSYGGVVITEAGNDPKVAKLVYIAAFAPDKGESVAKLIENPPPGAPVPPILPPQNGYLFLDKAKFAASFAGDVDAEKAALPGRDRRQDDPAPGAAFHVQACWFDSRRGQRQSRDLRVTAKGSSRDHRKRR